MVRPALKILSLALQFYRIIELFLSLRKDLKLFLKKSLVWEIHKALGQLCSRLLFDFIGRFCWPSHRAFYTIGRPLCPTWLMIWAPSSGSDPSYPAELSCCNCLSPPPQKPHFTCGVQQGSILRPMLFSLYWHPLRSISSRHKLTSHPLSAGHNSCIREPYSVLPTFFVHMLSSSSPMEIRKTVRFYFSCHLSN